MKCLLKCTAIAICLAATSSLYADPADDPAVNPVLNQLSNTQNAVQTTITKTQTAVQQQNANIQATLKAQAANSQEATNSLIKWLNANLVTGTPLKFPDSMKGNLQNILAHHNLSDLNWLLTQKFTLASLEGLDISQVVGDDNEVPTTTMKLADIKSRVRQFNIGSLLKTTSIEPRSADEKNALILLEFVSGLNNGVTGIPKRISASGMGPIRAFQTQFGTYLAQQSVGVNVLYGLLNERLVKPGLGEQLGGPEKNMSPLALDQYMATRRLNVTDPDGWLAQLSDASPAQVAKEQLMLMAEMRYEMYLMRRSQEQTNMLLATQQLQASGADADRLEQLKADVMSAGTGNIIK